MDDTVPISFLLWTLGAAVGAQTLVVVISLVGLTIWFNYKIASEREECAEQIRRLEERSRDEVQRQREELRNSFERERLQLESKIMQAFQQREQMYQELRLHARQARASTDDSMNFTVGGDVNVGGDVLGRDKTTNG